MLFLITHLKGRFYTSAGKSGLFFGNELQRISRPWNVFEFVATKNNMGIIVSHRPVGLSEIKKMKYFLIEAGIGYDRPSTIFKILIFKIFIVPNRSKN